MLTTDEVNEQSKLIHRNPKRPSSVLYKSEKDTLVDIQRLIVFEDYEGIRSRAIMMQKER